jgi:hypothetical protein
MNPIQAIQHSGNESNATISSIPSIPFIATALTSPRGRLSKRRAMGLTLGVLAIVGFVIPGIEPVAAGGMSPLLLHAGGEVTVVHPDEKGAVTFAVDASQNAVLNFDGRFVATTKPGSNQTTVLEVRDPWTAKMVWTQTVSGNWRVEAISSDGREVVLGDPTISATAASVPSGRTMTRFRMVSESFAGNEITLPGNFVAEAFLTNHAGFALIEHLPATNPTTYRVRPMGFVGGTQSLLQPVGGTKTAPRVDPEEMQGVRLNQTWNERGDGLYTLYDSSEYPKGEGVFVHALDLTTGLARCLDVPSDIDAGKGKGKVIFTGTGKLVVVGRRGIVRMDAKTGAIEQKLRVPMKSIGALFSQADKVYVSDQKSLLEYQVSTLRKLNATEFKAPLVAGTVNGQVPPIVVDVQGAIWYATNKPVLRGTYRGPVSDDALLLAKE